MSLRKEQVLVTRKGWSLAVLGFVLWALSPLLWIAGKLPLDTSLFIASTALLPWAIYIATRKRDNGGTGS